MKTNLALIVCLTFNLFLFAQNKKEDVQIAAIAKHGNTTGSSCIEPPPPCANTNAPNAPVRSMAEWEELQAIVVAWNSNLFDGNRNSENQLLANIIQHAQEECKVIVLTKNASSTQTDLLDKYHLEHVDNVDFRELDAKSVWIRDYGGNPAYLNDVDALILVDWIYNRDTRPEADTVYCELSDELNIPLYQTGVGNNDLVHTGGNYMSDGLGMAFSSKLILEENSVASPFCISPKTPEEIDEIMYQYLGIERFVTFDNLWYDLIHHIDMHMKLLNEETLLVGAYPENVSDYEQIEANLAYLQQHYKTSFGTDFKIIRIDMPAGPDGGYPDGSEDFPPYTYTNALFVNKTVLVPIYHTENDAPALDIWRKALPGYKIVGIDCRGIIHRFGAVHCITKEIGVAEPLLIAHQQVKASDVTEENGYPATARIQHRSGIQKATLYYKTTLDSDYLSLPMFQSEAHQWQTYIPHQKIGTRVYYYIEATAKNGKSNVRPLPAPAAYFEFQVEDDFVVIPSNGQNFEMGVLRPNPARSLTYIPVLATENVVASILIYDILGRAVLEVYQGRLVSGDFNYFFDAAPLASGTYFIQVKSTNDVAVQKFVRE